MEACLACGIAGVALARQRHVGCDHVLRIDPHVDGHELHEAREQQPGPDEQHEGDGELGRNQHVMRAPATGIGAASRGRIHGRRQRRSRCAPGGPEPERHARQRGRDGREDEDASVERDGIEASKIDGREVDQRGNTPERKGNPQPAAHRGQQEALGQDL